VTSTEVPLLGAPPLSVGSSPLGSLGDLLDKDERGEMDRKSNYFQSMLSESFVFLFLFSFLVCFDCSFFSCLAMSSFSQPPQPNAGQASTTSDNKSSAQRNNGLSINKSGTGTSTTISINNNSSSMMTDNHHAASSIATPNTAPSSGKPKAIEIEWIAENAFLCIVDQCKVEKSILSKQVSFRISTKVVGLHPHLNVCARFILVF
jgi:hypothetical protein